MLELLLRLIFVIVALSVPLAIVHRIYQREAVSMTLLAVGVLTYSAAFLIQTLFGLLLNTAILQAPLFGSLFIGIIIGFTDIGARFWGYYSVARSTVYHSQASMIGIGHALPRIVFNAGLAILSILAILRGAETTKLADGELLLEVGAGLIVTLAPLLLHTTLSWMVLQTFLRNEWVWIFQAIFFAGLVFGMEALITNTTEQPALLLLILWSLAALISWRITRQIQPPPAFDRSAIQP